MNSKGEWGLNSIPRISILSETPNSSSEKQIQNLAEPGKAIKTAKKRKIDGQLSSLNSPNMTSPNPPRTQGQPAIRAALFGFRKQSLTPRNNEESDRVGNNEMVISQNRSREGRHDLQGQGQEGQNRSHK